jgi:transposase
MGGAKKRQLPRIERERILNAFKAGPDAVISLIEYIQDHYQSVFSDLQLSIEKLLESNEKLRARIEALEEKNNKDSHNSSKPPSSDGVSRRFFRRRSSSGKKAGGQPGHEGTTLRMVKNPDHVQVHKVKRCRRCGGSLKDEKLQGYKRRQIFEIPPIAVEVSEHQAEQKRCSHCGELNVAEFPEAIQHRTQYGRRLQAFAVYLKNYGLLSYCRTAEALRDLFEIPISAGTLAGIDRRCAARLQGVVEQIRKKLMKAEVAHFDETGLSINGELHWLHGAGTPRFTYYYPHKNRGKAAADEIGILPALKGTAVHDNWKPYFKYDCVHSLCNAHHIRELIGVYEQGDQPWAQQMIGLLLQGKEAVQRAKQEGEKSLGRTQLQAYRHTYKQIIAFGMSSNPPPAVICHRRGRLKRSKARNLLDRLSKYSKETLMYLSDFRVPFDNNLAERDIRMTKLQQKISGTFRSYQGAVSFCRIRSYISTVRKHGRSVIDAIVYSFERNLSLTKCLANS